MFRVAISASVLLLVAITAAPTGLVASEQSISADVLAALPEGEGRETMATYCTQCHAIGMVTNQRHTQAEWEDVIERMVDMGFYASPEETEVIVSYLSEHFNRS